MFCRFCKMLSLGPAKALSQIAVALLLLAFPVLADAQSVCQNDGLTVEFEDRLGSVELQPVRVQEITGNNNGDRAWSLGSVAVQAVTASASRLRVNGLSQAAFPDNNINTATIERLQRNAWNVRFDRNDYEFANKSDLQLDIQVTVINNQASHISGASSAITVTPVDTNVAVEWFGGQRNSLKQIRGDLNFRLSDLAQLGLTGTHRAEIELCVNIRGKL